MADSCLLYYITDRRAFSGNEPTRRQRLLDKIAEAASHGVDYIQLREKDLSARDLQSLAREAMRITADGVHLRSVDVSPQEVRAAWRRALCGAGTPAREISPGNPLIAVSCHSPEEVTLAAAGQATFAVFAPVFEKKDAPATTPAGLEALRQSCHAKIPVLALGRVTLRNAPSCLHSGAAGIAAIRLFQENDIATIVRELRHSSR